MDATKNEQPKVPPRPTWAESLQQINNILTPAKEVVVILRPNPYLDTIIAGVALAAALRKIGRRAHAVCPTKFNLQEILSTARIDETTIPLDLDQVNDFLPQRQLVLTVDYQTGSYSSGKIQKTPEGLVITLLPETGQSPLEPLKMDSAIYESQIDAFFLLELEHLSHLGNFYETNKTLFSRIPLISLDYHANNAAFGTVNLIDTKASSLSEMVALMLYDLRFILDEEIGKTLFTGIKSKTGNFTESQFTANMLEAASICLRYVSPPKPKQNFQTIK
jgi:nanoRNase/pAp phosphatase (c-di-AMP/oligoRNAs hydrolase)